MAELKTKPNSDDIAGFLAQLDDGQRRDSEALVEIMSRITGDPPVMWGSSIIGFGMRHLKYESGRELDWMKIGFAPRKGKLVLYCPAYLEKYKVDLDKVGQYSIGKGCLYIKKLSDVDTDKLEAVLKKMGQDTQA